MSVHFEPMISKNSAAVFSLLLLSAFSLAGPVSAQETFETISGTTVKGQLDSIDENGALTGKGLENLTISQILSIKFNTKPVAKTAGAKIALVDGGSMVVKNLTIDGESISFDPVAGIRQISMQSIRSILLLDNVEVPESVMAAASDRDQVIIESAKSKGKLTKVSGVLESLSNGELSLNFKGKSQTINLEKVKVVGIVIADLGTQKVKGTAAEVSLDNADFIKGALKEISKSEITLELTGQKTLRIDRNHVSEIKIESENIVWLSSLEPVEASVRPEFTVQRPWQRNRSVLGNPMRLMVAVDSADPVATTFNSGIGTQSWSRIVFSNDKEHNRFKATVGVDMETRGRGDCVMSVKGDGIQLWRGRVQGGKPAVDIDVDIKGIQRVELIVEPGEQLDLADHANWAKARFLKTE